LYLCKISAKISTKYKMLAIPNKYIHLHPVLSRDNLSNFFSFYYF